MMKLKKLLLYILAAACLLCSGFILVSFLFPLPAPKPCSLVVYDRHGKFLHAYLTDDDMWRFKTSVGEIPPHFKELLLFKEDRYFYYHPGVNPFAVVRACPEKEFQAHRPSPCRWRVCSNRKTGRGAIS
jgi:penicillin-binding protein 1C